MASQHRRHSSVDTLGWMYTNYARDEPPPALNRSISARISSFRREVFPTLKRQSSLRFNPGEYFAGCFGPRDHDSPQCPDSQRPILSDRTGHGTSSLVIERPSAGRPPRSRSISLGNFEFDFGSMRFKEKRHGGGGPSLAVRAVELNRQAATHKHRVVPPGGRWVLEEDAEYFLKPPAWKQALRKLRAEARHHVGCHVHPFSSTDYDAESYEKNFDHGGPSTLYRMAAREADDDFGMQARILHSKLLTKLHSRRFEEDAAGHDSPPTKLVKTMSVPVVLHVLPTRASQGRDDHGVPIWMRRVAARPITNLELTRSI